MRKSRAVLRLVANPELLIENVTVSTPRGPRSRGCKQAVLFNPSRAAMASQCAMDTARQDIIDGYAPGPWGSLIRVTFDDMEEYRVRIHNQGDANDPILVCTSVCTSELPRRVELGKALLVAIVAFAMGTTVVALIINVVTR